MTYYTERHGMRTPIEKTYDITIQAYALLFQCCEKYKDNIAWKYPKKCPDGYGCCGLDYEQFDSNMMYEIPDLFRYDGNIEVPKGHFDIFDQSEIYDEYNQFALLDYIEFFAKNCRDCITGEFHHYFGHYHLSYRNSDKVFAKFRNEINDIFTKTGLLYQLTDKKIIERIIENTPLTDDIEKNIEAIKEQGTRELLLEAIDLYKQPYPDSAKNAVEKIWDALERLKTYYTQLSKKDSVAKIINDMSGNQKSFETLFNDEFVALTKIGNNYRIRHHETDKIDITDTRHYDYFFNRCLSLIALAIQYLN